MYINYNQFINENKNNDITQKEIELLNHYGIKEYEYNPETNLIDIKEDLDLTGWNLIGIGFPKLKNLPKIRFGTIYGDFWFCENYIRILKNCPKEVNGHFDCSENNLISLVGCPKKVTGDFYCKNNKLTSIEDYPLSIINGKMTDILSFPKVHEIVKEHKDVFEKLLDDKIKFHQMVMKFDPYLIQYYTTILPSDNKNTRLLI